MITSCHLKISALFAALLAIVAKADLRDELSSHFIRRVSISNVPLSQAVTTLSNIWEKTIGKDVMFRIDQQEGDAGGGEVKLVTIVAENISFYEAFSIICAEAQMDMDFDDAGNAVIITDHLEVVGQTRFSIPLANFLSRTWMVKAKLRGLGELLDEVDIGEAYKEYVLEHCCITNNTLVVLADSHEDANKVLLRIESLFPLFTSNAVPFEARGIQSSRGASLALADDPPSAGFAHFARSVEAWFANSAWGSLSRRRDFSLPNAIQRELNRARIRESHKTGKPAKGGKDAAKKKEGTDYAE